MTDRCRYTNKEFEGENVVRAKVLKWHVAQPLEVAENGNKFTPVMESSKYKELAYRSNKSKSTFLIVYFFLFTSLVSLLNFYLTNEKLFNLMLASGVVFIYSVIDYVACMRNISLLQDKSKFIQKAYLEKKGATFYFLIMFLLGALQYCLTYYYGDFDQVIMQFGGVYNLIDKGEYWRIFSASIFHSGVAHWLSNLAILIIFVPCLRVLTSKYGFSIFIVGAISGAATAYLASTQGIANADGYVGTSGGIYSLIGYFIATSFIQRNNIPLVWLYTALNFGALNILISFILLPNVSSFAHLTGFLIGTFWAIVFKARKYQ